LFSLAGFGLVVSIDACGQLKKIISKMTYNALLRTLNPAHSLTH